MQTAQCMDLNREPKWPGDLHQGLLSGFPRAHTCSSQDLRDAAAAPGSILQTAMQSMGGPEYLADASALSRAGLKGAEYEARYEELELCDSALRAVQCHGLLL